MNGLEFVASLARSLAWPLSVLLIAFLFRSPIRAAMAGQLRRLKVGPIEAEYWEMSAAQVIEQLPAATEEDPDTLGQLARELGPLVEHAPRSAVLEAFGYVVAQLSNIAEERGMSPGLRSKLAEKPRFFALLLQEREWISASHAAAIEDLTDMRDLAAHPEAGVDIGTGRAAQYVALVELLLYSLRRADQGLPRPDAATDGVSA
jgi:hypothetical protein